MQRVSMPKRLRVDHRQKWRWLSLLEPHRESCRPVGDRRANVLTANCATQALQLHQPSDRAACHRNAFPAHLLPDLRHAADRPVDLPDTLALRLQDLIAFGASAAFGRITKLRSMASVARRRNPQDLADRLAPEGGAMLINEGLQDLKRRSSSSRLTQSHSVCGVQPIIGAIDSTAAHFDCRPLRRVLATLLAYQAHCALPDFRGKLARLLVCSWLHSLKSWSLHKTRRGSYSRSATVSKTRSTSGRCRSAELTHRRGD
ncbi:transposase domain protein [Burkholderia pseudomallei MSHR4308]|nr:transposase domain protein [Burkholderia pseudomallei MSHR4304]KGV33866.1 transposase domain protein [Burkholderia pseudomallei MSHR4308]